MFGGENMLGLKKDTVVLYEHEEAWELEAQKTIIQLKKILGNIAVCIEHIGSTSIKNIKAKPIIDIAVAVNDFEDVMNKRQELQNAGYYYREHSDEKQQLLFARGSYYDGSGDIQTHFIHFVLCGSMEWINYINFRDYLNTFPEKAKQYESLKVSLARKFPFDEGRKHYLEGKQELIKYYLRKSLVWSYLGKTVAVKIDRPIGYVHKKEKYSLTYPINYGYIPNVFGGDSEELDVYVLGISEPVAEFSGKVIGIAHRENDVEDKLIAAPEGENFTKEEIGNAINFQEQYYKTMIEIY
jgi:GrpB-like predicted nucleotidyltransferase (UPF0157 family)